MFTNPSVGQLTIVEVANEISRYIAENPNRFYQVVIGTDSQTKKINGIFEIHIDVGPLGPTREMIKEVVGMVQGDG